VDALDAERSETVVLQTEVVRIAALPRDAAAEGSADELSARVVGPLMIDAGSRQTTAPRCAQRLTQAWSEASAARVSTTGVSPTEVALKSPALGISASSPR
jgi:hypothetical protein